MHADDDPRAWRVATALAYATGLDWARWAKGICCRSMCCRGRIFYPCKGDASDPVPAPWDTDAYLADCRLREVEPGPLPSLEYRGDGVRWRVLQMDQIAIDVGDATVEVWSPTEVFATGVSTIDDLVRATNLARVAAEAMR